MSEKNLLWVGSIIAFLFDRLLHVEIQTLNWISFHIKNHYVQHTLFVTISAITNKKLTLGCCNYYYRCCRNNLLSCCSALAKASSQLASVLVWLVSKTESSYYTWLRKSPLAGLWRACLLSLLLCGPAFKWCQHPLVLQWLPKSTAAGKV